MTCFIVSIVIIGEKASKYCDDRRYRDLPSHVTIMFDHVSPTRRQIGCHPHKFISYHHTSSGRAADFPLGGAVPRHGRAHLALVWFGQNLAAQFCVPRRREGSDHSRCCLAGRLVREATGQGTPGHGPRVLWLGCIASVLSRRTLPADRSLITGRFFSDGGGITPQW